MLLPPTHFAWDGSSESVKDYVILSRTLAPTFDTHQVLAEGCKKSDHLPLLLQLQIPQGHT